MSKVIEKLTPEQEALLPVYRQKWIDIGLDCGECNLEEAKKYARLAYQAAGLVCPENFYLADSPIAAAKLAVQLKGEVNESDTEAYSSAVYEELNNQTFGSHEAGWLGYYDFVLNELGIEECRKLEGLIGIAKNVGWWAPYDACVIFQHRHSEIHLDDQFRLHNENGPAVAYRDGYKVWAIDGVRLNEKTVMAPETLTVEEINATSNNEARAIMINRFGWARYLTESQAECLDYRHNDVENTKEALYHTEEYGNRLVVTCPTGRMFVLGVPDSIETCEDAQVWLGGGEKFNVLART
jgi:hypothetical protein